MPSSSETYLSYTTFGGLLKYLRRREHLTQLELSIAVGYSEAQISRLEKDLRLPDLTSIKALFIPALHLEDELQLVEQLLELAQMAREVDDPAPGVPPYKGLLFFEESDAEMFFGREELTKLLVKHIFELNVPTSNHFMAVVGDSGSGKSSLMRAGVAVAFIRAGWEVCVFTPTDTPMKILEEQLNSERIKAGEQVLVIVDQFEETFTLCHDELERIAFIGKLLSMAQDRKKKITVVIALRADFYSHCANYPHLRQVVAAEQEFIGQMTLEELRRAIEEPAKHGGWEFEPGLVDVILTDLSVHGSHVPQPGALPLLSHALLSTWESRRGRKFTLDSYQCSGGVRGAIAETAESIFTDQLDQAQQEIAHNVFLRLTELGDGTEDTRRRVKLNELITHHTDAAQVRVVLNILAKARLINLNEDSAEVAHEALIREWLRLREWLTQDRENLLLHRHLTQSANEWEIRGHDSSELYRGARLAQAREWALENGDRLNDIEKPFLSASIEQQEREAMERDALSMRELEATRELAESQKHAARQLQRRAVYLLGALVLTVIAALVAGIFADRSSVLAKQNASIAQTAQAVSKQALVDFTRSEAQRLAAEANSLTQLVADPQLIALLSLRSIKTQYTTEGDAALTQAAALPFPQRIFSDPSRVYSVVFSPDDKYVLIGGYDGMADLIDAQTGQQIRQFRANDTGRGVKAIFSPDGQSIFAASNDNTVWKWDLKTGKVVFSLSFTDAPIDIEVSPDGKRILTGNSAGTPLLLDAQTGETICRFIGHTLPVWELAFSPDAGNVATSSVDGTIRIWKTDSCELLRAFSSSNGLASIAYSTDGKYLATGGWDGPARLWDVETGQVVRQFIGHTCSLIKQVRFSPDGKYLLTGSCDKTARLWDVQTGNMLYSLNGHTDELWSVAFSHDGRYILTGSHDKTAWLWDLQKIYGEHPRFIGHTDAIWSVAASPDDLHLVTSGANQSTRLWDSNTGQKLYTFSPSDVNSVAISPDGRFLLAGDTTDTAWLLDFYTGQTVRRFFHGAAIMGVAFSADGKYALTSGQDAYAKQWDIQTGELLTTYGRGTGNPGGPDTLYGIAYSPDGQYVLTGGWDGVMRLYDAQNGKELRQFTADKESIYGVAFSPDGRLALSGSKDKTAHLWDVQTGQQLLNLIGHTAYLYSVAFSPDGRIALTGSADNTARLWDLTTGQELRRFTGHMGAVEWTVFSSDGKTFFTGSDDGTARRWDVDYHDTVKYLCSTLLRDFTSEERTQYHITDTEPTCPYQ